MKKGGGGTPFDDLSDWKNRGKPQITSIKLRYGGCVDDIQVVYQNYTAPLHGGHGGDPYELQLVEGEYITRLEAYFGVCYWGIGFGMQGLAVHTNFKRDVKFGNLNGEHVDCNFGENYQLGAIYGTADDVVWSLGAWFEYSS
jgi:hypothetical protein